MIKTALSTLLPMIFLSCAASISAATIPFSFTVTGGTIITAAPMPTAPAILIASGTVTPFGPVEDVANLLLTFGTYPGGIFALMSGTGTFTFSFNGGTDTYSGDVTFTAGAPDIHGTQISLQTSNILSGTGIFAGATGFSTIVGTTTYQPDPAIPTPTTLVGTGQITAAALAPEPASLALLGIGLTGIVALNQKRKPTRRAKRA